MVSVGVSRMGKTRVVFVDPGAKINRKRVCYLTSEQCRHYRWTLQQDGAPAHIAWTTMDYLKTEHINFIEPHMWPQKSPDI